MLHQLDREGAEGGKKPTQARMPVLHKNAHGRGGSEASLEEEVQAEGAVLFAEGYYRPLFAEGPFHTDYLRIAARHVGDVGERNVLSHLLLQGKARLRVV